MLSVKCEINPNFLWLFKLLSKHLYALPVELDNEIRRLLDNEEFESARILISEAKLKWGQTALQELDTLCSFLEY